MSTRFWFVLVLCSAAAMADPITYNVNVDTSSISGTAGSLDFNFNPGPFAPTQAASLQILNFSSNGSLAGNCPCGIGDVAGELPLTVTFDNGTAFNDYFDGFTYGSTLAFQVSLYGLALSSPDGLSNSGSTFAFSMFSDADGTVPALTSNATDGFAVTIDVNLDGTTTVTNYSPQAGVTPLEDTSAVPEPNEVAVLAFGMLALAGFVRRRRQA